MLLALRVFLLGVWRSNALGEAQQAIKASTNYCDSSERRTHSVEVNVLLFVAEQVILISENAGPIATSSERLQP